ncbi:Nramp family divalent metal transporter [Alkalihalobacillus sp. CinArs1]|uniref:Nramp family divalent metal transporter n=1 Tax=Alkalihalobacillus sp. CinArs1 TaxID=2995314 RepID=UPI0022DDCBA3|nr:Nramp family divalent metal transporter [Alkalihalobacillus sp. CinArs1]
MSDQNTFLKKLKSVGPGAIVAAAFIGPGTVTTATQAGAGFGFALMWALVFSILATITLHEMSARLGITARMQLGEAMRKQFSSPLMKGISIILVLAAIGVGTAAYETGNILGGALGLSTMTGISVNIWGPVIGIIAAILLYSGNYKAIEKVFVVLVLVMSVCFVATAIVIKPDLGAMFKGAFLPTFPTGGTLFAIALIGTTVVPYNIFLHSSTVQEHWRGKEGLKESRFDTVFSIIVGGLISLSIVVSAAVAFPLGTNITDASEMAVQLEPLLGSWAKVFFAIGLLSAGITSSISAPLAAAYAISGVFGWSMDLKATKFRVIWGVVILIGIVGSALGMSPTTVIIFAQYANGLMLPIISIFLLYVMNNKELLGEYVNRTLSNILGGIVLLVTLVLALHSLGILELFL